MGGFMSEELQIIDMDLKDLFIKQDIERLMEALDRIVAKDVLEINEMNWVVVKKYYDMGRQDLLRKHLSFVAYTSFITEYAGRRELYSEQEYQVKFGLFEDIYQILQEKQE
jgi:hypothetical protein